MKDLKKRELSEVIQSSNLNFLLGAGISFPFFPLLNDIEFRLNAASEEEKEEIYKEYLEKVMLPNQNILSGEEESVNYLKTKAAYEKFLRVISQILIKRKSTILSKQANLFTTNIDVFLESSLEALEIEYNDGFSGKFKPSFGLENYKKSIHQRSLHFDHISEIPVFNVVKIHGSTTWKYNEQNSNEIVLSSDLAHFDESMLEMTKEEFISHYSKILVVNPEEAKHLESVLNTYYSELLRLYSSELEKENAVLFIIGFSMADRHIKEITLRAAKSNPTLRIYFISHSHGKGEELSELLETDQNPNIEIIEPIDDTDKNKLTLEKITDELFQDIWNQKKVDITLETTTDE